MTPVGAVYLPRPTRKEESIAVGITDDECARTPRLCLELLEKSDACRLKLEEKRLCVIECDGRREQMLPVPKLRIDRGFGQASKIQPGSITNYLPVEGRLAVDESDSKSQLRRIELTCGRNVRDKELGLGGGKYRFGQSVGVLLTHVWTQLRPWF